MRKCVEWNKKTRNIKDTFKYSGVAGSARVEPGVHVNYRCWCRWMWWLSSLSLLYTPLLSRAVAVLLRAFWVHGCALVHSFIIRYQITMWKKWKNNNKCSLKLDLDPIQWETRSTGGCRWLSPSYPSVIIRLARPNDTRKHCRPLVLQCWQGPAGSRDRWWRPLQWPRAMQHCSTEGGEVTVILVQGSRSIRCLHCSRQYLPISPFSYTIHQHTF